MADDRITRSDFFRAGGRRAFEGLLRAVRQGVTAFEAQRPPPAPAASAASFGLLRPPGALPEVAFLDTCLRCGKCVDACPPMALFPAPDTMDPIIGTPVLRPRRSPCVLCPDVPCAAACPSGALRPIPVAEIRLGVAVIDKDRCVRWNGEPCHACIVACPIGEAAIRRDGRGRPVVGDACTGCGLCERACPTDPASVRVQPAFDFGAARE